MPRVLTRQIGKLMRKQVKNYKKTIEFYETNQNTIRQNYFKDKQYWQRYLAIKQNQKLQNELKLQIKTFQQKKSQKSNQFLLQFAQFSEKLQVLKNLNLQQTLKSGSTLIAQNSQKILEKHKIEQLVDEGEAHRSNNPTYYSIQENTTKKNPKYVMVEKGWKKQRKVLKKVKLQQKND